ncbi:MAG: metallophosphoesterase, partial [Myxococcota bacterium]
DLFRMVLDPSSRLRTLFGSSQAADPSRRAMIARSTAQAATAMTAGIVATATRSGLAEVEVKEVEVKMPRWPRQLSGLTVVQMSDIHVGALIGKGFIDAIVEKANAQKPDVICITGDLVDGSVEMLRAHVAPLAKLKARYGVFFVTGNHEYYSGAKSWIAHLGTLGIQVMRNGFTTVGDSAKFDIAGVDDHSAGRFYRDHGVFPERIADGRDPDRPLLLMAHQPRSIERVQDLKPDLVLSGHTHGGQLWPLSGVVTLVQPYLAGLYRHNEDTQIYVSSGTGYWGPPMRLLAPSEITKLHLT